MGDRPPLHVGGDILRFGGSNFDTVVACRGFAVFRDFIRFGWSLGIGLDLQLFVWLFRVGLSMPRKLVHKGKNPPFTD
ncbi:hypothetical protein Tco_1141389 [Tanacetum coccineum]